MTQANQYYHKQANLMIQHSLGAEMMALFLFGIAYFVLNHCYV